MRHWTARGLGIASALGATVLGFAFLLAAGAPVGYLAIQAGALAIGLVALPILAILSRLSPSGASDWILPVLGAALLVTALFGLDIAGAARWVRVGAVTVQPSLVLLPLMLLLFARRSGPAGAAAMVLAAAAMALQPDRAMAGVLAASLATLSFVRPDRLTIGAAAFAFAAFAVALFQPDALPAVPYVDGILYSAFDIHLLVGAAVLAGSALLLLPALGACELAPRIVFATAWLAIVAAAALGNYPTPLVGYGGSAVLGYLLSVALLPGRKRSESFGQEAGAAPVPSLPGDPMLRAAA